MSYAKMGQKFRSVLKSLWYVLLKNFGVHFPVVFCLNPNFYDVKKIKDLTKEKKLQRSATLNFITRLRKSHVTALIPQIVS